jgi:glycosyltransferase involved in cell wall biosynthesis
MTINVPKVSIITVVLNNKEYIEDCIRSVVHQNYDNYEHIIVDGGSTDGTLGIIEEYRDHITTLISEPDHGIYDAMNKGIKLSTGDIVGILNSDDYYCYDNVITEVVSEFSQKGVDSVFADLVYVDRVNTDKIVRYYKSAYFSPKKFEYGWMPAHPTFSLRRKFYEKYGLFKTDYKIGADFELLVRLLGKNKLSFSYLPRVIIKMRKGGISTASYKNNWILNMENIRACRENGIQTNIFKIFLKYVIKISQFIERPTN